MLVRKIGESQMVKGPCQQPAMVVAQFVEVTSKAGKKYFRGQWAEMSMRLVSSGKIDADTGGVVWNLIVSGSTTGDG